MDDRNRNPDLPTSADRNDLPEDKGNLAARLVGEGVVGMGGMAAGATVGSFAGPVGTLIGALAGTVGGWWAGKGVADAVTRTTDDDDAFYRQHYETKAGTSASRTYDDVRPAYHLGHLAAHNPDYQGRTFEEVEPELQRGWSNDLRTRHGDWSEVRGYASDAYVRGRSGQTSGGDLTDRAGDAARRGANRVIDAVDNVKDRIDGDPASKPGPDATDRRL